MCRARLLRGCAAFLAMASAVRAFQLPYGEPQATLVVRARPAAALEPAPLLRVDSSLVLIPVQVTNAAGGTVTGLGRSNFRLLEDSVEQAIGSFATEDSPVSIGLLFDASGSMHSKIGKSAEAAAAFFRTANPEDEFFLVEFNDRARLVVPFTRNAGEVYRQIARTRAAGRTTLIDAIYLAVAEMKNARHTRKALVIFSDGGDNWSRHSVRETRTALLESGVQVYAMGIFDPDYTRKHPVEERRGPALLEELTSLTGGREFPVNELRQLPDISERIGRELHSQYLLGYYPQNAARDGKYRHVRVTLAAPDAAHMRIDYRRGYYSPAN